MNIQHGEWLNQPKQLCINEHRVIFTTQPETDFWQRTNYGYQRNSGHAYLFTIAQDTFTLDIRASFTGNALYDQCGIFLYQDEAHWAKASMECDEGQRNMLGAVVTNLGYSDWSIAGTIDRTTTACYYRLHKKGQDFLIESSFDGIAFSQLRMFHLQDIRNLKIGIYACSPLDSSFEACFDRFSLSSCSWDAESHI